MAAVMGQVTAPTSPSTIPVCTVPPGSTVTLSSVETTNDVFLGTSSSVTAASGFPLDNGGPTTLTNPPNNAPFSIYACSGTGTHIVGFCIITP